MDGRKTVPIGSQAENDRELLPSRMRLRLVGNVKLNWMQAELRLRTLDTNMERLGAKLIVGVETRRRRP
ncbi:hypothetical protein F2Q70_00016691 [Brassica cretica]|uniref:Uncharacterized protein n=1 Tax=Brassica cretica TaxID=69181 RepID=A0A8S9HPG7_BRACR|nr:hypothetical protein F2Q70_00016691 [Brassica cretica]KAF3552126.1 hypothetical protein DY000_02009119 [Brassica cretica]